MSESDPTNRGLLSFREILDEAARRFDAAGLYFGHGTDNAWDEALFLALHALGLDYDQPESLLDSHLSAQQQAAVERLVNERLSTRKPAAYLTGSTWFAGHRFVVDEHVLVPRSPIAELIADRFAPWVDPASVGSILDMCTGSGCIAIACAHAFPDASIDATDISAAALGVAMRNRSMHGLDDRMAVHQGDLFEPLKGTHFDLIVANPPYVDQSELASMPEEYRREPTLGLAAGEDGLNLVRRILAEAEQHLAPGGVIIVEVGASAPTLALAYPRVPFTWLEFEHGGDGVFLLDAEQLAAHRDVFKSSAHESRTSSTINE